MKTQGNDICAQFAKLKGQHPWRARLGHGSFLTFDFGPRVVKDGHVYGTWHLWVYLSNWVLTHNGQQLATSDSNRHQIALAVRRLENVPFTGIELDSKRPNTVFHFDHFRLSVSPADYVENPDRRDEYWLFFMPGDKVITASPGGIELRPSDIDGAKLELSAKTLKRAISFDL